MCMHEQVQIDNITDSLMRETQANALQDEKIEFFSAIEKGRLVLGDTILHIAVRMGHENIVDFLLLTDHVPRPLTSTGRSQRPITGSDSHKITSRDKVNSKSVGSGLNSAQTPNFKGELPSQIAPNPILQLVMHNVNDVHDIFGAECLEEPKLHRLVHSLRRIWPLWMFEGQQETANLVRVVYDVRSSDTIFGNLVKLALTVSDRFRTVLSRDGIRIAIKLMVESKGQIAVAKQTLLHEWTAQYKRELLFALFIHHFRTWQWKRDLERDQHYVDFFDTAMEGWLHITQDLHLHQVKTTKELDIILADEATLRRYDLHIWKMRLRPQPSIMDELCTHIDALESYLNVHALHA